MAETNIEWTATPRANGTLAPGYTFNPWRGCTKVSPGCANCYAEALSLRNPSVLGEWGPNGERVTGSDSYWRWPLKWDREAKAAGERRRVFCASLADVFEDRPELDLWRERLWRLIRNTPNLDWLLLTKRPENFAAMLPWGKISDAAARGLVWRNVWLGISVEEEQRADERIPLLLKTPAAVRFLSVEPMLGPVDLKRWLSVAHGILADFYLCGNSQPSVLRPNWVIVGGESGPNARPFALLWARSLRDQCAEAGVLFFFKQAGSYCVDEVGSAMRRVFRDRKGGDLAEIPEDLRIREWPQFAHAPGRRIQS